MLSTVALVEREVAHYQRALPELACALDLYAAVFQAQESVRQRVPPWLDLSNDQARAKLQAGTPVLDGQELPVDPDLFRSGLESIAGILVSHGVLTAEKMGLLQSQALRPADLPRLAVDAAHNDWNRLRPIAAACGMEEEAVAVLLRTVLVPFYQAGAAPFQGLLGALWRKGTCPFCGGMPRMARMDGDGRRSLYCSICRSEWPFARLACPFCEGYDAGSLDYLLLDWDKGHRADVCNTCKRYIKASDERVLGRHGVPDIEDLATIPLDLVAARNGYTPP